jgi:ABC-type polysaccharide/polyol phosphate export permease
VLVAPGSRSSLAIGKICGSATVALLHGLLFAVAAPLAGLPYAGIDWVALVGFASLAAISLTAMGFVIAWVLDSIQGYHVVMNVVLFPAWILSGAMFPPADLHPALRLLVQWNPMTYFMAGIRGAFYDGAAVPGLDARAWGAGAGVAVAVAIAAAWVVVACVVATRRPGTDRP